MPNVTISVPDDLKDEMDKFAEVSWSEICRKAITQYITERKNPTPNIELDLRNSRLSADSFETGYPTLSIDLRVYNKMNTDITIDRILANIAFLKGNERFNVGAAYDLEKRWIGAKSVGGATIHLPLLKEKLQDLLDKFEKTFECYVSCTVYTEDFRQAYHRDVRATIPIDVWKDFVEKTLKLPQSK